MGRLAVVMQSGEDHASMHGDSPADCLIVGAGPAGLTAALYMARYRRRVRVLHDGAARALRIPLTHNAPAFPDGISGLELIDRMCGHAEQFGAQIIEAKVERAGWYDGLFQLDCEDGSIARGRSLILATGLHLNQIPIPPDVHEDAIKAGVLSYCPICDGYEHIDKRIAVIGCDAQGASEALFLRRYSADVTLIPRNHAELTSAESRSLRAADIAIVTIAADEYIAQGSTMQVRLANGDRLNFDVVYPALGVRPRNELALQLGLNTDENGNLDSQTPFETQHPGLFSAGDIVAGLDQINVAIAHGAIAATKAHNWLRQCDGESLN